jgi:hypothetical protein
MTAHFERIYHSLISENEENKPIIPEESPADPSIKNLDPDQIFRVREETFKNLSHELEKISRRKARYGIPPVTLEVVGEEMVEAPKFKLHKRFFGAEKVILFKLHAPDLKMSGGWKFVARIDHESIGNIIVRVPGSDFEGDLHQMFGSSQPSTCDHCGKIRRRTSTFVIQDQKGELKRIGRQCLKDYLPGGVSAAEKVAAYAEYLSNVFLGLIEITQKEGYEENDERGGGSWGGGSHFRILDVFTLSLYIIDKMGYISNKQAYNDPSVISTAETVKDWLTGELHRKVFKEGSRDNLLKQMIESYTDSVNQEYEEKALTVLEWAPEYIDRQLQDPKNSGMMEYFNNLKTIIDAVKKQGEGAYVSKKHIAFIVSLIPGYKRDLRQKEEIKAAASKPESNYVGLVGMPIGELKKTDIYKAKKNYNTTLDTTKFPYNGPIELEALYDTTSFDTGGSYGYYGPSVVYKTTFVDPQGNQYVASAEGWTKGDKGLLKRAIVKDHKEYFSKKLNKTIKQTRLARADIQPL